MPEIEHLSNPEPKIYFRNVAVKDVKITFNENRGTFSRPSISWNIRSKAITAGYTKVLVFYDCNGIQMCVEGPKEIGERFIPATTIQDITVDYFEDYKFDKA